MLKSGFERSEVNSANGSPYTLKDPEICQRPVRDESEPYEEKKRQERTEKHTREEAQALFSHATICEEIGGFHSFPFSFLNCFH